MALRWGYIQTSAAVGDYVLIETGERTPAPVFPEEEPPAQE